MECALGASDEVVRVATPPGVEDRGADGRAAIGEDDVAGGGAAVAGDRGREGERRAVDGGVRAGGQRDIGVRALDGLDQGRGSNGIVSVAGVAGGDGVGANDEGRGREAGRASSVERHCCERSGTVAEGHGAGGDE